MRILLAPFLIVLAACGAASAPVETAPAPVDAAAAPSQSTAAPPETAPAPVDTAASPPETTATPLETIRLPVSLYIVVSNTGPSSTRTVDEVTEIGTRITDIWSQAGIVLDITVVGEIQVPPDVIAAVADRDGRAFLIAANQGRFEIPDPGALIGFYVPDAGGANGFAPLGLRTFFVTDEPTVLDERVSSHEIGHLLGLHHALDDPDRLMFSGTNGMTLTPDEIAVARYIAQGMIDGLR